MTGVFSSAFASEERAVYCFRRRFFSDDYLKKLHSIDRRKKMGAEKSRRRAAGRGQIRNREGRGVRCKDGFADSAIVGDGREHRLFQASRSKIASTIKSQRARAPISSDW